MSDWFINWDNPPPRCGKYDTDECMEKCNMFGSKLCLWSIKPEIYENEEI